MNTRFPPALQQLTERYDPQVFELGRPSARLRLSGAGPEDVDVVLDGHTATVLAADRSRRVDAVLTADARTWKSIVEDLRGGMDAYRAGRLRSGATCISESAFSPPLHPAGTAGCAFAGFRPRLARYR